MISQEAGKAKALEGIEEADAQRGVAQVFFPS
jgi:hypothetical protein